MTRSITEEQRTQLGGIFLLEHMAQTEKRYPSIPQGADAGLKPLLEWLHQRGYADLSAEGYEMSDKGEQVLLAFLARFEEFLGTLDLYGAVDLEEGRFAFERFFEFEEESEWQDYLAEERFNDLRVAVAEFKQLDAPGLVFMACVNDGTLSTDNPGWQEYLTDGSFWRHAQGILDNALSAEDLSFEDEEGAVDGLDLLKQVIVDGAELNLELKKEEAQIYAEETAEQADGPAVDEAELEARTVAQYEPYLDPQYVAPVWRAAWLL